LEKRGLRWLLLAIEQEIEEALTGARYQRSAARRAQRWTRDGYVVVDGQKVPIQRGEVRVGTYELFSANAHPG
jgi:hypothetical protein